MAVQSCWRHSYTVSSKGSVCPTGTNEMTKNGQKVCYGDCPDPSSYCYQADTACKKLVESTRNLPMTNLNSDVAAMKKACLDPYHHYCSSASDKPGYCKKRCQSCQYVDQYQEREIEPRECPSGYELVGPTTCYGICRNGYTRDSSNPNLCVENCGSGLFYKCSNKQCAQDESTCTKLPHTSMLSSYNDAIAAYTVTNKSVFTYEQKISETPKEKTVQQYTMSKCQPNLTL